MTSRRHRGRQSCHLPAKQLNNAIIGANFRFRTTPEIVAVVAILALGI
jgi:hypothetical protein